MNVLFVLPDQHRSDFVGFLGRHPVRTPCLDRLAARGTTFSRAWTPSPLCAPARACFTQGCGYDRSPVRNNADNLSPDGPSFFRHLRDGGWRVATCGKLDLLKGYMDWGRDGRHAADGASKLEQLGFTHGLDSAGKHDAITAYQCGLPEPYLSFLEQRGLAAAHVADFSRRRLQFPERSIRSLYDSYQPPIESYANVAPTSLPDDAYVDNWVGASALGLLEKLSGDQAPWFLMVNFPGPHEPLDVTANMRSRWLDVQFDRPYGRENRDPDLQREIRRNYAAMIETIDGWLGRFVDFLGRSGQLDDTLVIYASDHGDMLGDRNLWAKQVPYEPSVSVPLVIAGPGVAAGRTIDDPVSLIDLPPTVLDGAGLRIPPSFDGVSLRKALAGDGAGMPPRAHVTTGLGSWRAITDGRFKLIVGLDENLPQKQVEAGSRSADMMGEPTLLYDLASDPQESRDRSQDLPDIRDALRRTLIETIVGQRPEG